MLVELMLAAATGISLLAWWRERSERKRESFRRQLWRDIAERDIKRGES